MGDGKLLWRASHDKPGPHPESDEQSGGDGRSSQRQRQHPAAPVCKPWLLHGRLRLRRLGEEDDLPAFGTLGQMGQALLALLFAERSRRKGVELIGVGVGSGMVALGHRGFSPVLAS